MSIRDLRLRVLLALTLLAWLGGSVWHGAMRIGIAFGDEVCTSQGAKYVPGDAPGHSGQAGSKSCPLCAAFGAPGSVSAFVAVAAPSVPFAASLASLDRSAVVPAAHLADLASRAPPRA